MTDSKIPLAGVKHLMRKTSEAEIDRFEAGLVASIPKMAADLGMPVDQFRAVFAPHLARQIATMREMHRLSEGDLDVMADQEEGRDQ